MYILCTRVIKNHWSVKQQDLINQQYLASDHKRAINKFKSYSLMADYEANKGHWFTVTSLTAPKTQDKTTARVHMLVRPSPSFLIHVTPPIEPHPQFLQLLINIDTINTNQELDSSQQVWGGEWSHSFCSRPQVGSLKGMKPIVMRWSERVLPWRPAFLSISPKSITDLAATAPPIYPSTVPPI